MDNYDDEQSTNYEFLVSPKFKPLTRSKENCFSPPSSNVLKELHRYLYTLCAKHIQSLQKISSHEKFILEEERLPTIEETDEEESTFRKNATQQIEITKIKELVQQTLQKDLKEFERVIGTVKRTSKQQEEIKLVHKKMALLIQENQEMRRVMELREAESDPLAMQSERENIDLLMMEIERLKKEASKKGDTKKFQEENEVLIKEKASLEKKYKELSKNLTDINDAMELLEDTNKELLQRTEALEKENATFEEKCKTLEAETQVKNEALDKAQKVIKELYQESLKRITKVEKPQARSQSVQANPSKANSVETMTEDFEEPNKEEIFLSQIEDLTNKVNNLNARNQTKDLEISGLKDELVKMQTEYESTIETLKIAASRAGRRNMTKSCMVSPCSLYEMSPIPKSQCSIITTLAKPGPEQTFNESIAVSPERAVPAKVAEEPVQKLHDPLVPLLITELERYLVDHHEFKAQYQNDILVKLKEHEVKMREILKPVQEVEKSVLEMPKKQRETCAILSELFHMVEQYNQQTQTLADLLWAKKELVIKLEEENFVLKDQAQRLQDMANESVQLKDELEDSNRKYMEIINMHADTAAELKKLKKAIEEAGIMTSSPSELAKRLKALTESEQQCEELQEQMEEYHAKVAENKDKHKENMKNVELMDGMLKDKEQMIMSLREEISFLGRKLENHKQAKADLETVTEKARMLQAELERITKEKAELEKHNNELQDRLEEQTDKTIFYKATSEQRELENHNLKLHLDNAKETYTKEYETEIIELKKALEISRESYNEMVKKLQLKDDIMGEMRSKAMELSNSKELYTGSNINNSISEMKTLRMILLEKSNYIAQLEQQNNELRHEYERTLQQQLDSQFSQHFAKSDSAFCGDCERLRDQLSVVDKKRDKYKHKFQKRVKEFDTILKHIERLLCGAIDSSENVAKIVKHNDGLKKWLDSIQVLVTKLQAGQQRHYDFLKFVLSSLENVTKRDRIRGLLERSKYGTELMEMEKVAAEEFQQFLKIHTKCYLPVHYHN